MFNIYAHSFMIATRNDPVRGANSRADRENPADRRPRFTPPTVHGAPVAAGQVTNRPVGK